MAASGKDWLPFHEATHAFGDAAAVRELQGITRSFDPRASRLQQALDAAQIESLAAGRLIATGCPLSALPAPAVTSWSRADVGYRSSGFPEFDRAHEVARIAFEREAGLQRARDIPGNRMPLPAAWWHPDRFIRGELLADGRRFGNILVALRRAGRFREAELRAWIAGQYARGERKSVKEWYDDGSRATGARVPKTHFSKSLLPEMKADGRPDIVRRGRPPGKPARRP